MLYACRSFHGQGQEGGRGGGVRRRERCVAVRVGYRGAWGACETRPGGRHAKMALAGAKFRLRGPAHHNTQQGG